MITASPIRSLRSSGSAMKNSPNISTMAAAITDVHTSHALSEVDGLGSQSGMVKQLPRRASQTRAVPNSIDEKTKNEYSPSGSFRTFKPQLGDGKTIVVRLPFTVTTTEASRLSFAFPDSYFIVSDNFVLHSIGDQPCSILVIECFKGFTSPRWHITEPFGVRRLHGGVGVGESV